jgi:ribosome-binding factor A
MIKAVMKLRIEGIYLNISKAVYDKSVMNSILNEEKQTISSKVRNEKKMYTIPILTQYKARMPSQSNKVGEINK